MTDPNADLAAEYDVPRRVVQNAEHMDRIEAPDGTPLYVLVSSLGGDRTLVHADVVEFDGRLDHPMTTGVLGFFGVGLAFLLPLVAAYFVAAPMDSVLVSVAVTAGCVLAGWVLANVALYRSPLGDWLFRFLEWNEHKFLIMRGQQS